MKDGRIFFVDHSELDSSSDCTACAIDILPSYFLSPPPDTNSTQWEDPRLMAKNKPTAVSISI